MVKKTMTNCRRMTAMMTKLMAEAWMFLSIFDGPYAKYILYLSTMCFIIKYNKPERKRELVRKMKMLTTNFLKNAILVLTMITSTTVLTCEQL